jgi:hypothetical protein
MHKPPCETLTLLGGCVNCGRLRNAPRMLPKVRRKEMFDQEIADALRQHVQLWKFDANTTGWEHLRKFLSASAKIWWMQHVLCLFLWQIWFGNENWKWLQRRDLRFFKGRPIFIMKVFCNNFNKTFSSKVQENVTTALYTLNYDFCLDTWFVQFHYHVTLAPPTINNTNCHYQN